MGSIRRMRRKIERNVKNDFCESFCTSYHFLDVSTINQIRYAFLESVKQDQFNFSSFFPSFSSLLFTFFFLHSATKTIIRIVVVMILMMMMKMIMMIRRRKRKLCMYKRKYRENFFLSYSSIAFFFPFRSSWTKQTILI